MASLASVTARGIDPPVSPLDRHMMSGETPACSQAKSVPVRPHPVITSSAMKSTSCAAQISRIWRRLSALRSEEHTSELQSLMRISYAVFCLKKKNKHNTHHTSTETN